MPVVVLTVTLKAMSSSVILLHSLHSGIRSVFKDLSGWQCK